MAPGLPSKPRTFEFVGSSVSLHTVLRKDSGGSRNILHGSEFQPTKKRPLRVYHVRCRGGAVSSPSNCDLHSAHPLNLLLMRLSPWRSGFEDAGWGSSVDDRYPAELFA